MKKMPYGIDVICRSLIISLLVVYSIIPAAAQNIATSFSTSKVNATTTREGNTMLSVFPNPAADEAKLVFYATKYDVPYQVRIVNNTGASLKKIQGATIQGQNVLRIHLGNYPPGIYYVQLITTEGRETLKLLKQPLHTF